MGAGQSVRFARCEEASSNSQASVSNTSTANIKSFSPRALRQPKPSRSSAQVAHRFGIANSSGPRAAAMRSFDAETRGGSPFAIEARSRGRLERQGWGSIAAERCAGKRTVEDDGQLPPGIFQVDSARQLGTSQEYGSVGHTDNAGKRRIQFKDDEDRTCECKRTGSQGNVDAHVADQERSQSH